MKVVNLNRKQLEDIESRLEEYDEKHITYRLEGEIHIGIEEEGKIIAGLDAEMTAFKILYVSTLFVDEAYRRKGYGTRLVQEMEKKAHQLGANMIRLDTFDWQGKEFYKAMGYEIVGSYENKIDGFAEYFFLKRLAD